MGCHRLARVLYNPPKVKAEPPRVLSEEERAAKKLAMNQKKRKCARERALVLDEQGQEKRHKAD